ncbi:MAG TPA: iron-containing alcohol dehydrogenase [Gaiellaceae bacterium]|nr:iron-containing alcohol dehydrogenase [Gaiellaceae bacterium]
MIVRFGLGELPGVLADVGIARPLVIASERWRALDVAHVAWSSEVPSVHVDVPGDADGILAIGGGSAIDTGKHTSAESGLPVVHVPTTYSGAEWTTFYGVRSPDRRMRGGGAGAHPVAIVYDVDLTLDLPRDQTAGTAMNALAHCAEALYAAGHRPEGDEQALLGAPLIADALPRVLADLSDRDARENLLRGAMHAGHALGIAGLALAHAMAQALGGAYGLPHGAMNALCLAPGLAFNAKLVPEAVERFGDAVGGDAVERSRELARLGGFERLRDFGIPEEDLPALAAAAAQRGGNQANPRPASPAEVLELFRRIY